jgi:hypothetical protein
MAETEKAGFAPAASLQSILFQFREQLSFQMPARGFLDCAALVGDGALFGLAFLARSRFDRARQMNDLRAVWPDLLLGGFGVRLHVRRSIRAISQSEAADCATQNSRALGPASLTLPRMNWDAINAVSQLISSIAVVVSVLYLAVQLRSSTRVARVAAMDVAASALRDVTKPFMENAELGRVWRTGLENFKSLSPDDQARFFHAAHQFLKALETIHFHYVYGLLDTQLWEGWRELLRHYVATPGLEYYLSLRGSVFSQRFCKFISELEPLPERFTVANFPGRDDRPNE